MELYPHCPATSQGDSSADPETLLFGAPECPTPQQEQWKQVEVLWVMAVDWHLLKLGTEGMWPVLETCGQSWRACSLY